MEHYFTNNQIQIENRKEISFRFLSFKIVLDTADNVFSKDRVDQGSTILLETLADENLSGNVLDYGCGYGVIGIVLAKLGLDVEAVDVVDRAVLLTKDNAKKNGVNINVYNINDHDIESNRFDTVVLNPPIRTGKENIFQMYTNGYNWLKDKGVFYIVIRKQHGAKSTIKFLETLFDHVSVLNKEKGYWVIKCNK